MKIKEKTELWCYYRNICTYGKTCSRAKLHECDGQFVSCMQSTPYRVQAQCVRPGEEAPSGAA